MSESRHSPRATTGLRLLSPGAEIDAHWHDEHQIVYAGRGVLSVGTDAGSWVAPATRALWIPAGTVHEHRAHGSTDLHMIGLAVRHNPLGLDRPAVISVSPLLRELIISYSKESDMPVTERRRLLAVMLDQLRHSAQEPIHLPAANDPRLAAVCAILRENPADNRTLRRLGAVIGASDRTLARLCRAELGMTFPQWRTQLRLHHALCLLAEGASVSAVAQQCGWSSSSAFIDVFRRSFGHTPGAHRTL